MDTAVTAGVSAATRYLPGAPNFASHHAIAPDMDEMVDVDLKKEKKHQNEGKGRPQLDIESLNMGPGENCLVFEAYPSIKQAFFRRVYTILTVQLIATTLIGYAIHNYYSAPGAVEAVTESGTRGAIMFLGIIGSFASLMSLHFFAKKHPTNLYLLGVFTFSESIFLGYGLMGVAEELLFRALLTTTTVFIGLILYTVKSKNDFSFLGASLFSGLWILIFGGFLQWLFPTPEIVDMFMAWMGALLFCGFVIFDTWRLHYIMKTDEHVLAAVNLYLDFINLFLQILKIMSKRK